MSVQPEELADWFYEWPDCATFTYENLTDGMDIDNCPTPEEFQKFVETLGSGRCKFCASDADYIVDCGMCAHCLNELS